MRLIVIAVAVTSAVNTLGTAISPYLLVERPLLLVGLSAEVRHIVLAGGRAPLLPLVLVGTLRRVISMVATYGLAAAYGFAAVRWIEVRYPRIGAFARALERLFLRYGAVLLVVFPGYTVTALAGASRAPFRPFLLASLLGQTWVVLAYVLVGESIMGWTAPLLAWLEAHLWESTGVAFALVLLQQLVSWIRRRRALRVSPPSPP